MNKALSAAPPVEEHPFFRPGPGGRAVAANNHMYDFLQGGAGPVAEVYAACVDWPTYDTYVSPANLRSREGNFIERFGFGDEEGFRRSLENARLLVDLGCGPGIYLQWLARLFPDKTLVGMDFSDMLGMFDAKFGRLDNLVLARVDLNGELPLQDAVVDFAICDYVLDGIPRPGDFLAEARRVIAPGGRLAISISLRQPLVRGLADQHLMDVLAQASPGLVEQWAAELTALGRELHESGIEIELKNGYPLLGVTAGKLPLQRFIYNNFLKCFWNGDEAYSHRKNANNLRIARSSRRYSLAEIHGMFERGWTVLNECNDFSAVSLLLRREED